MKVLFWNIQDLTQKKLNNPFSKTAYMKQIANSRSDFISKVIGCNPVFASLPFLQPASGPIDIVVIVEVSEVVASVGVGGSVNTNYDNLLTQLVAGIQTEANASFTTPPTYQYVGATTSTTSATCPGPGPIVCTGDETVGIIYNASTVTPVAGSGGLMVNTSTAAYPAPRAPFLMVFQTVAAPIQTFAVVANHAPPVGGGGAALQFAPCIDYTNELQDCGNATYVGGTSLAQLLPANSLGVLIGGDFNCCVTDTYTGGNPPFSGLYAPTPGSWNSTVTTFNATNPSLLSGVRHSLGSLSGLAPANPIPIAAYLGSAYDDILYSAARPAPAAGGILDLLGLAQLPGSATTLDLEPATNLSVRGSMFKGWLRGFGQISDHLPVGLLC